MPIMNAPLPAGMPMAIPQMPGQGPVMAPMMINNGGSALDTRQPAGMNGAAPVPFGEPAGGSGIPSNGTQTSGFGTTNQGPQGPAGQPGGTTGVSGISGTSGINNGTPSGSGQSGGEKFEINGKSYMCYALDDATSDGGDSGSQGNDNGGSGGGTGGSNGESQGASGGNGGETKGDGGDDGEEGGQGSYHDTYCSLSTYNFGSIYLYNGVVTKAISPDSRSVLSEARADNFSVNANHFVRFVTSISDNISSPTARSKCDLQETTNLKNPEFIDNNTLLGWSSTDAQHRPTDTIIWGLTIDDCRRIQKILPISTILRQRVDAGVYPVLPMIRDTRFHGWSADKTLARFSYELVMDSRDPKVNEWIHQGHQLLPLGAIFNLHSGTVTLEDTPEGLSLRQQNVFTVPPSPGQAQWNLESSFSLQPGDLGTGLSIYDPIGQSYRNVHLPCKDALLSQDGTILLCSAPVDPENPLVPLVDANGAMTSGVMQSLIYDTVHERFIGVLKGPYGHLAVCDGSADVAPPPRSQDEIDNESGPDSEKSRGY